MQEQMIFHISIKWHKRPSENVLHCLHRCQQRFIRALRIVRTLECPVVGDNI